MDKCRLMNWKQFVYKEKEEEKKMLMRDRQ